ncbi:MAG TPA: MFS transporter [Pyrinomonadaceae bacterium]|nr:MFS transporter [Pyrinomonadaceae bacterium]
MFSALRHRNFRRFWAGAFLSNTGTWMQTVAQGWLVLQLTDSAFWLGFDGFAATAPGLVLTLLGGVFADLLDRKRLLIITQTISGLVAFALALLVWTEVIHFTMILVASFVTGCCFSLAGPSYQAITIDLAGRRDLSNAIALNSAQFQLSRVLGPTFAGLAFKLFGVAGCFFVNSLSYIAIVASLLMVRFDGGGAKKAKAATVSGAAAADDAAGEAAVTAAARAGRKHGATSRRAIWRDLVEGFRYVWGRPRLFMLLTLSAVTSVFGTPYLTMMPLFARDVLRLDESGLSILLATAGAGSFAAALWLTYLGDVRGKGWYVLGGTFGFGLSLVGFALSTVLWASLAFLFLVGFGVVSAVAVSNILLQQLVTDEMRGRVMSMFILSFIGAWPIGNLLAGTAAKYYGAPLTLAAGGAIVAAFVALVAARNPRLRAM